MFAEFALLETPAAMPEESTGSYVFFGAALAAIGTVLVLFRTRMTEDWADWMFFPFRGRPAEGWLRLNRFGLLLMGFLLILGGLAIMASGLSRWL
jgi:hypothetical protein